MPADPQEAGVGLDVGDDQRLALGGDAAGHALAERDPRPADLVAVEAVRRGQRQVRSVAVEQVERGDVRVERVAGPVDDGLEQLVPRPRRRREPGDLVQEAELLELVGGLLARARSPTRAGRAVWHGRGRDARHGHHHTSLRKGCGPKVAAGSDDRSRNGPGAWRRVSPRKAAVTLGRRSPRSRSGSGRPARATRWRARSACSARCSARSSPSRPVPSCSRLVERIRRRTIALRRDDDRARTGPARRGARGPSTSVPPRPSSRAFALYFRLVNLAEARSRVRTLRRRERAARDGDPR